MSLHLVTSSHWVLTGNSCVMVHWVVLGRVPLFAFMSWLYSLGLSTFLLSPSLNSPKGAMMSSLLNDMMAQL
jgi:hypothetical protein